MDFSGWEVVGTGRYVEWFPFLGIGLCVVGEV